MEVKLLGFAGPYKTLITISQPLPNFPPLPPLPPSETFRQYRGRRYEVEK